MKIFRKKKKIERPKYTRAQAEAILEQAKIMFSEVSPTLYQKFIVPILSDAITEEELIKKYMNGDY